MYNIVYTIAITTLCQEEWIEQDTLLKTVRGLTQCEIIFVLKTHKW